MRDAREMSEESIRVSNPCFSCYDCVEYSNGVLSVVCSKRVPFSQEDAQAGKQKMKALLDNLAGLDARFCL